MGQFPNKKYLKVQPTINTLMVKTENKIEIIPLIVGLAVLLLLGYIITISLPPQYQIYFYIFIGLVIVGIGIITYFCIKNQEFREKTFSVLKKTFARISDLGTNILENIEEGERREKKKKRVPIPSQLKNKVHDIAGGKCQLCGREGNLKIHHIDGDPSNNNITNLVLLCGNHHDDADKGVISKWRLKHIRNNQATHDHTSYSK